MSVDFGGWRRFNFFDKNVVHDKQEPDKKYQGLTDIRMDSWCSSDDAVYLGESRGGVFRLSAHLEEGYWKSFDHSLTYLYSADRYMFAIGCDEADGQTSVLKIWERDKIENETPVLKKSIRLVSQVVTSAASAIAVHSQLGDIAVGFLDGSVLLYQGDVIKDKCNVSRWHRIREGTPLDGPITGLALARLPLERLVVFVITAKSVYSYLVTNKSVVNKLKHDAAGAPKDCWTFDERTGQLVVASKDMVYFHDAEQCVDSEGGRGRCYQLGKGHEKLQLVSSRDHLVLLTKQQSLIPTAAAEFMSMVTVYDVKGQYIAFACSLPSLCKIFSLNGALMILSGDGTLSELIEKNLNAKLDILFKKNLYDVALGLARHSKDGAEHLKSIHAKYGDYLYGKGDFDNAINEYKDTIGMLQPSYVIKKFHDDTKLRQLCVYMEALHDTHNQNAHHTSILLHCYARLGERKKIMKFIDQVKDKSPDMIVAFQVLRQSRMCMEASLLATKLEMHAEAIDVMVNDLGKYPTALKIISRRPPTEACKYVEKYGRTLFEHCADETMELILNLLNTANEEELDALQLLAVFVGDNEKSTAFTEHALTKVHGTGRKALQDTILELRMRAFQAGTLSGTDCLRVLEPLLSRENADTALHLAQLFEVPPVVQHVLTVQNRWHDLLQYYMKKSRVKDIIELCRDHGSNEMWLEALVFVAKCEKTNFDEEDMKRMLQGLENAQCVHPLVVLEMLSRSETLTVAALKEYIVSWLVRQEKQIDVDRNAIAEAEKRMTDIDRQIESLKFNVQVVQVSKCCACDTSLQLPAVHFLCRHSYHVHCFESYSDGADSCPACTRTSQQQSEHKENLGDKAAYDKFQRELNSSINCMDLVSKYLRMGLFDAPKRETKRHPSGVSSSASRPRNPFEDELEAASPFFERSPSSNSTVSSKTTTKAAATAGVKAGTNNPFETPSQRPQPVSKTSEQRRGHGKNPFTETTNPFDE